MKVLALLAALAGCYVHRYPVTPEVADPSVYKIVGAVREDGRRVQGTAWIASPGLAVTAGHLCDFAANRSDDHSLWLVSDRFQEPVRTVEWNLTGDASDDWCLLRADGSTGRPLVLAAVPPAVGTADTADTYPDGVHTVSHGVVLPTVEGEAATSAAVDHGSSGGPVFTPAGVYGIVAQCRATAEELCAPGSEGAALTPIDVIKSALDGLGASYDVTPDDPPDPDVVFPHNGLGD